MVNWGQDVVFAVGAASAAKAVKPARTSVKAVKPRQGD